jgi:excisionase family DNA binding protein
MKNYNSSAISSSLKPESGLATPREAAALLGLSEKCIRRWISDRRLPAVHVGRCVRIRRSDLAKVIAGGLAAVEPGSRKGLL